MKRPQFKDFRQGITVYTVHAFAPYRKGVHEKVGAAGWVEKHEIQSRPYLKQNVGYAVRIKTKRILGLDNYLFLSTFNIVTPHCRPGRLKNNHGCFWTHKQAERHLHRISRGCLTKNEWQRAIDWKEFLDDMREMDRLWESENPREAYEQNYPEEIQNE